MYAVIKSGGKQYRVRQGDTIRVERLDAREGDKVELVDVLMIADGESARLGTPYVGGARVAAVVKAHGRGAKIQIIKFKRRTHHLKRMGHRQGYTELLIDSITND